MVKDVTPAFQTTDLGQWSIKVSKRPTWQEEKMDLCVDVNLIPPYRHSERRCVVLSGIKNQGIQILTDWDMAKNVFWIQTPISLIFFFYVNLGFEDCKWKQSWISLSEIHNQGICIKTEVAIAKYVLQLQCPISIVFSNKFGIWRLPIKAERCSFLWN